ncbi:MAG: hypothetical protein C0516_05425 [Gemmatimonas sp.]|uniref:tetratricopeptide repeat protein n=1 Tax=Gemmatimonas sp. UBA7669 TaxID=1946568 RepID=UPI0025C59388|nr:tetratricopeptide repeat protein [Gemmatimonas sp. UBA7669]MBA3918011.1 hypothetical protein [Gemmatimonas sp.]
MSTAARIDELRKKFEENPRRFFAPLANELRKAGDLSQAIALCREHLPKQPGHMSGYIVFGQALYETGELDEARGVFEQALALDPENLIALRHLGDIARRQDQPQVARRWYERVLEADPRNDDIAAQLASLATPTPSVAAIPAPASFTPVVPMAAFGTPALGSAPVPAGSVPAPSMPTPASFTPIDLAAIPTPVTAAPAIPTPVVAAPAIPTPVSAAPAIPTPVSAAPAIPTPITAAPAIPTPISQAAFAPIDLDSMVAEAPSFPPALAPTPIESFPAILPTMPTPDSAMRAIEAEADPFHFAPAEPVASSAAFAETRAEELEAQAAQAESEAAMAFEEGLVAPEWPDTTDLLARRETPRSVTPLSVPVTPDAAQAFGLEKGDALSMPLPEPEPEIEVELETELVAESVSEFANEHVAHFAQTDSPITLPLMDLTDSAIDTVNGVVDDAVDDVVHDVVDDVRAFGADADVMEHAAETEPEIVAPFEDVVVAETEVRAVSEESFASLNDELTEEPSEEASEEPTEPSPAFVTETMGELLVAQGFVDRAVTVYEELVRRRPYDPVLAARLQELQDMQQSAATGVDVAPEADGAAFGEPVSAAIVAPESETGHAEPIAVYTARERFASLAARRVSRRTPAYSTPVFSPPLRSTPAASLAAYATPVRTPAVQAPGVEAAHDDSLASLFGDEAPASASAQDEFAARQLASAFDPQSPDVGSLSDSFFAGAAGHREPTPAFGTVRQPTPIRGVAASPTPAAPTPAAPQPPAPGATGEFSFDRFFPDPARQTSAASGAEPSVTGNPAASAPPAADDLAQFSAWLKGLGNS